MPPTTADEPDAHLRPETRLVVGGRPPRTAGQPLNVPVVLASNFQSRGAEPGSGYGSGSGRAYSREDGSPGWDALEAVVGDLEGGHAVAFASGMAAIAAVVDGLPVGARIVAPADSYGGMRGLLRDGAERGRWEVDLIDAADTDSVIKAITAGEGAALLWLETPSNPQLDISDLPALCEAARATGTVSVVDNTFATPLLQRPLELGADVVVHSGTKFISGHSDLLIGLAVAADPARAAAIRRRRGLAGATPGALEAYLALRGLRTLAVRVRAAQASAQVLAERLASHPSVTRVRYPGLPSDPGHERAAVQMDGFGAMLSFEVADAATADAMCDAVEVIQSATSLGGVETTMERRAKLAGDAHVNPGLLRLSVGCEHVEDLWADLDQALARASH